MDIPITQNFQKQKSLAFCLTWSCMFHYSITDCYIEGKFNGI